MKQEAYHTRNLNLMTGRLLLQNITQQIHQLNNRQGELTQPIVAQFGSLHLHLQ
jgi:hypothetical protein